MEDRMRLFGPVWGASGVQGFFGEGYWFHRLPWPFGSPSFDGCTFVAKTTTLEYRAGNTPLTTDCITPRDWFPRSVKVYLLQGSMLNSWGLSGPGAAWLFGSERWQTRTEPFMLSVMSVRDTEHARLCELESFVRMLGRHLPNFKAPIGLQINLSCPNVGLNPQALIGEALSALDIAGVLGVPLVPKINVLVPPEVVAGVAAHEHCAAICTSNTVPWGARSDVIPWEKFSANDESPLKELGGGGLSGKYLLRLVVEHVRGIRALCPNLHINACGGIMDAQHVNRVVAAGASSISIGSVATLRPWRMRRIIARAYELLGDRD